MNDTYGVTEWQTRQIFVELIATICAERAIAIEWLSDYWIASLRRDDAQCFLHGYVFPLNTAVAAGIMRDKVSTYAVLKHRGIPAIPHYLVRLPATRNTSGAAEQALRLTSLPIVLKANASEVGGGQDVYKCTTQQEVARAIDSLATRHQTIAASPFVELGTEYRVVVLDDKPLVVFEKIRPANAWQHNLKLGATPKLIDAPHLRNQLESLAVQALAAVQGRIAAVDVVATTADLQIMEINGGITLTAFASHSITFRQIASHIYAELIESALQAT